MGKKKQQTINQWPFTAIQQWNTFPCGLHHLFQNRFFKSDVLHHIRVYKDNFILQELDHAEVLPNLYEGLCLFNIFKSKNLLDPYMIWEP